MSTVSTAATSPWMSRLFDATLLVTGVILAVAAAVTTTMQGWELRGPELLAIPLIVLIARFPMLLDRGQGGIEVGFDSCVLMYLLCVLPPQEALVLWSVGVAATQLLSDRRAASKRFNIGLGILGGAVSAVVIDNLRGDELGSLQELGAVALAAAAYFATDFLLSALSVSLEEDTSFWRQLAQPGTLIAVGCFVPFDSLGYLAAVVVRSTHWWTLLLLGVPLVTLLVATRAVTRGGEDRRRLGLLFEAAVRAQTLSEPRQVVEALQEDARRLLRLPTVEVRSTPPEAHEIGARIREGQRDRYVVAPVRHRARSTSEADQKALDAMAAVASDAFARLDLTQDMTHLARHDVLTDLPNRGLLLDRLEHAVRMARRRGNTIALLFCDLDEFKPVNDRFGHAAGDAVLVDVAQRLTGCVRETDTVARLGGDEFAILLEDVRAGQVDSTCARILAALSTEALVAGHQIPLSTSIGVALGDTASSAEDLLRNADMAMYEAKAKGKNQYVQYERALGRSRVERLELLESLRAAIGQGDLSLVYQPVVTVGTSHIVGVEALARWSSNGVSVPPEVFVRAAEESGLVCALGELVFDLVAADAPALMAATDGGPLTIGVNVSAQQLRDPGFVGRVEETITRMAGADFVLELTERDGVTNDPASREAISWLAEHGVAIAIDDFGVGFSSISYLQDMPIKIIKADGSFSSAIDRDERSCKLLRSITLMGQALGLDVVVEGIERQSQLEHLRDHVGAMYAQGFLLHRPMPLAQVTDVLRRSRSVTTPALTAAQKA